MAIEQELKDTNPLLKEFQNLLDQDFKDRKLKENEIIKATVTEVTKVVVSAGTVYNVVLSVEAAPRNRTVNVFAMSPPYNPSRANASTASILA